jgi:flotillin
MLELVGVVTVMMIMWVYFLTSRFKRCPADKILVVYGKTGNANMSEIYTGGGVFVWPVIQDFAYLDRTPLTVTAAVNDALEEDGYSLSVSGVFVVAIGETKLLMEAAANRLLTLSQDQISDLCKDVINGQLRLVVNALASVEINDRKRFVDAIYVGVNEQLNTIGLQLLNVDLNEVRWYNPGNTANQAQSSSTEEQHTKVDVVDVELRSDQIDALLKGGAINLQVPGEARTIRISTSSILN